MKDRKPPSLTLHKPTGQARARIDGRDHYLGEFGTADARQRYQELIEEWRAVQGDGKIALTVDELSLAYLKHADSYYRKNGTPTSEPECIRYAVRHLVQKFGTLRAREISPKKLKAVRELMIEAGMARGTINKHVERIRRMYKWAASEELIPATVFEALKTVDGLRAGRSNAREPDPIKPVCLDLVVATLPFMAPVVADMVRLQLLTGARSGEICSLRPCDITKGADGTWTFIPESHKTQHRGKSRRIHIGPEGQRILGPYLSGRSPMSNCFSPIEAAAQDKVRRHERATSPRRPDQKRISIVNPRRAPGSKYTSKNYGKAVSRACRWRMPVELKIPNSTPEAEKAGLNVLQVHWLKENHWHPHQLRHTAATTIRREAGIETVRAVLGHSSIAMSELYAEQDDQKARAVIAKIG